MAPARHFYLLAASKAEGKVAGHQTTGEKTTGSIVSPRAFENPLLASGLLFDPGRLAQNMVRGTQLRIVIECGNGGDGDFHTQRIELSGNVHVRFDASVLIDLARW